MTALLVALLILTAATAIWALVRCRRAFDRGHADGYTQGLIAARNGEWIE